MLLYDINLLIYIGTSIQTPKQHKQKKFKKKYDNIYHFNILIN